LILNNKKKKSKIEWIKETMKNIQNHNNTK
jgi:hypothetical protein